MPRIIRIAPGIMVPKRPPMVESLLAYACPRNELKFAIQYTPRTTAREYITFEESFESNDSGQKI